MDCIENFIIRNQPCLTPASTIEEASRIFRTTKAAQLSIVDCLDKRRPVGILNEHGLIGRCLELKRNLDHVRVKECMQSVPLVLDSDMGPDYCFMVMGQHHVEQAPVIDGEGRYIGELRREDLPVSD